MWCEPEFHRAGPGKMFMENKENESLKISAKLVDLEDAEEFLKKSAIGKEKIKIAAGDKKSEKVSMEVPVAEESENFQAREDNCEELNLQDYQLELENRIRNLLWTISGDYTQQMKPDVSLFLRSKDIALYDGIKQGALAKFFDKDFLGMYLVKKIFMGADEAALTFVSQLCIEEAIGERICEQRPGIWEMQRKACEDILDQEYETMPSATDKLGYLRVNLLRRRIDRGENADASNKTITNITEKEQKDRKYKGIYHYIDLISNAAETADTMSLIRIIDTVYNEVADPDFSQKATLEQVLAVTMEDLTEFDWHDYLSEEMYEDALESYMEQLTSNVAGMENADVTREMEEERKSKQKITVLPPEALEKAHTYVELNFGRSYLSPAEEKRMNYLMCRGIHGDCTLYFTEGILKNPVRDNYQYQYAKRLRNKNIWVYHDKHRIVKQNISELTATLRKSLVLRIAKRNISMLTELLKKALVIRSENQEVLSDRGTIVPSRLWRVGRSSEANLFKRILRGDNTDFAVDVLIDARVDADIRLDLGQNITFQVKNNGQVLSLSPLFTNMATEGTVLKALEMASLPTNESTVAMTKQLMDAGFPIDKNTLQQIWHESNVFPEAAIEDIVNLHRLELPVTEENLTQMASYRNLTYQLTEGITAVAESLNSTLQGLTTNGEIEQAATIYGHILELLIPGEENPEAQRATVQFPDPEQTETELVTAERGLSLLKKR